MSKGSGEINVTTEVGYCNFCGRPRTLRREERHLGDLVRTMVTCESCHRTLTTSIGAAVPTPDAPEAAEAAEAAESNLEPATAPPAEPPSAPAPSRKPAGAKARTPAKPKAPARRDAKR